MESYFQHFGGKACCFEDLKPYVGAKGVDLAKWVPVLEAQAPSFVCFFLRAGESPC